MPFCFDGYLFLVWVEMSRIPKGDYCTVHPSSEALSRPVPIPSCSGDQSPIIHSKPPRTHLPPIHLVSHSFIPSPRDPCRHQPFIVNMTYNNINWLICNWTMDMFSLDNAGLSIFLSYSSQSHRNALLPVHIKSDQCIFAPQRHYDMKGHPNAGRTGNGTPKKAKKGGAVPQKGHFCLPAPPLLPKKATPFLDFGSRPHLWHLWRLTPRLIGA